MFDCVLVALFLLHLYNVCISVSVLFDKELLSMRVGGIQETLNKNEANKKYHWGLYINSVTTKLSRMF